MNLFPFSVTIVQFERPSHCDGTGNNSGVHLTGGAQEVAALQTVLDGADGQPHLALGPAVQGGLGQQTLPDGEGATDPARVSAGGDDVASDRQVLRQWSLQLSG